MPEDGVQAQVCPGAFGWAVDAHSVAVVALWTKGPRQVAVDDATVALRLLIDRRDGLGHARADLVNRIHKLLLELLPGGAKAFPSAPQARALLATVRPRDLVGRTRRRLASELITELAQVDKKIKTANKELTALVEATGSSLQQLNGIGPSGAARLIGDVRRRQSLRQPGAFRLLERHCADRRERVGILRKRTLLRRPATPPFVSGREPAYQPGPAHHGRRAVASRHRRPRLLPPEARRR